MAPPPVPATQPTPCPADPLGRALDTRCNVDPCVVTSGTGAYRSYAYVIAWVPGGDHGHTSRHSVKCTVPIVPTTPPPSPTLPNTGSSSSTIALVAGACLLFGLAMVAATRRNA